MPLRSAVVTFVVRVVTAEADAVTVVVESTDQDALTVLSRLVPAIKGRRAWSHRVGVFTPPVWNVHTICQKVQKSNTSKLA